VKLLVLAAAYPSPSEPERAVYIENLTRGLVADGGTRAPGSPRFEATVVAPRVHEADPLLEMRSGIPVRRFPQPSRGRRLKEISKPSFFLLAAYFASGLAAVMEVARREGSHAILCHWILPTGPIGAAASALLGLPLVLFAHGSDLNRYALSTRLRGALARWALRRASLVLAASADLRRIAIELGSAEARSTVLPMGVDDALFPASSPPTPAERADARRGLGLKPNRPLILFVGDVTPEKGVPELIEALAALSGKGLEVQAALLGDGPLLPALREGSSGRWTLPGRVPQPALREWYRAADLLVLPSHAEGSPVTVMEAHACGLPVVGSRVGGIPDLVDDGRTGWLVPPRDGEALAAVLDGLLRNPEALETARARLAEGPRDHSSSARARALAVSLSSLAELDGARE